MLAQPGQRRLQLTTARCSGARTTPTRSPVAADLSSLPQRPQEFPARSSRLLSRSPGDAHTFRRPPALLALLARTSISRSRRHARRGLPQNPQKLAALCGLRRNPPRLHPYIWTTDRFMLPFVCPGDYFQRSTCCRGATAGLPSRQRKLWADLAFFHIELVQNSQDRGARWSLALLPTHARASRRPTSPLSQSSRRTGLFPSPRAANPTGRT